MRILPPVVDDPNDPSSDPSNTDPLNTEQDAELDDNGYPVGTEYDAEGNAVDEQNNPFGTVYDGDGTPIEDENGNPFGTEYNGDGTPILADPPAADATPPARAALPPLTTSLTLTAEQRALLEERVDPEVLEVLQFVMQQQIQAAQASMAYANTAVDHALADASPEFRAALLPRVTQFLAQQTPEFRATPHAADQAILVALAEDHMGGDARLIDVMQKYVDLYNGTGTRQPARPAPPAVRPPATRTGKPSNGQAPPSNSARRATGSRGANVLSQVYGISEREAAQMGLDE